MAWRKLNETYDLDLQNVNWVLSNDKKSIVPIAIKLEDMGSVS